MTLAEKFLSPEWRSAAAKRLAFFAEAVFAHKLIHSFRARFERELVYFSSAFGAFPVALEGLLLEAALIVVISHFAFIVYFVPFYFLNLRQNNKLCRAQFCLKTFFCLFFQRRVYGR